MKAFINGIKRTLLSPFSRRNKHASSNDDDEENASYPKPQLPPSPPRETTWLLAHKPHSLIYTTNISDTDASSSTAFSESSADDSDDSTIYTTDSEDEEEDEEEEEEEGWIITLPRVKTPRSAILFYALSTLFLFLSLGFFYSSHQYGQRLHADHPASEDMSLCRGNARQSIRVLEIVLASTAAGFSCLWVCEVWRRQDDRIVLALGLWSLAVAFAVLEFGVWGFVELMCGCGW